MSRAALSSAKRRYPRNAVSPNLVIGANGSLTIGRRDKTVLDF